MIGTPGWMGAAACKGCDTNRWFPERGEPTDDVKAICRACPVIAECLEYALTTPERAGVWGGTSEKERRRIRRQRAKAARGVRVRNPERLSA